MVDEKDLIEFNDNDAIRFIINSLSEKQKEYIDEDCIQYILDLICEYYEQNGLIEADIVDEAEIAEDDILNFISTIIKKEKVISLSDEDIQTVLDGEYQYGISIGIYSESED